MSIEAGFFDGKPRIFLSKRFFFFNLLPTKNFNFASKLKYFNSIHSFSEYYILGYTSRGNLRYRTRLLPPTQKKKELK